MLQDGDSEQAEEGVAKLERRPLQHESILDHSNTWVEEVQKVSLVLDLPRHAQMN